MVGVQRLAVHLVGDQDLRRRIGCVGEGERAHEAQVGLVGLRQHRLEVIRAVVGAVEADLDAVRCRAAPARGRRAGGRPSSGRSRRRSRPTARRPAAAASSRRPFPAHSSVTARSTAGMARRSSSVSVVGLSTAPPISSVPSCVGHREVAADIVELGRGDLAVRAPRAAPLRCTGAGLIISKRGARSVRARLSLPCLSLLVVAVAVPASVVGVLEGRVAVVVEGADALDAVGMHGRAPVRLHHDRDRLLDRLPLAQSARPA